MTARTNRPRTPRWKIGLATTASALLLLAGAPLLGTAGAGLVDEGPVPIPAPIGDELPPNKPLCTNDAGGPGEHPDDCADEAPCLLPGPDTEGCGDSRVGGDLSPVVDDSGDDPDDGGGTPDDGVSAPTCADDPTDRFVDYCETYFDDGGTDPGDDPGDGEDPGGGDAGIPDCGDAGNPGFGDGMDCEAGRDEFLAFVDQITAILTGLAGGGTDPGASPDPCDSDPSGGEEFGGYDCRSGFAALTAVPEMIVAALTGGGGGGGGGGGAPSCSDDPSGQFADYCEQFSGGSGGGDSAGPSCSDDPSGQFTEYCEQFSGGGEDGSGDDGSGASADAVSCDNAPDSYRRDCGSGYAWLSALVKSVRRMTYGDPSEQLESDERPTPRALCDAFATLGYTGSECYDYYEEWGASYFEPEEESADCPDEAINDEASNDDDDDTCDSDTGDSSNG